MGLDKLQQSLNKKYSKGKDRDVVIKGDDIQNVSVLCSSGTLSLDVAIGIGGLPRGRIMEFYGPPSGGKTLLSLLSIIEAQKLGKNCSFIDLENSFDIKWFENLGGNRDNLILIKPDGAEEAFSILEDLVISNEIDLVVLDSIAAMMTEAEKEGSYGDAHMAVLARLMSTSLKKINQVMVDNDKISIIMINQVRSKMKSFQGHELTTTTGGKSLEFYSSVRLEVKRGEIIGDKEYPEGFRTKIKVTKNKVGPPMRKVEVSLYIGKNGKYGADINEEIVDVAIGLNVIERLSKDKSTGEMIQDENGIYYKIGEETFYGRPKLFKFIKENPDQIEEIKKSVFAFMGHKVKPAEGSFDDKMSKRKSRKKEEQIEEEVGDE